MTIMDVVCIMFSWQGLLKKHEVFETDLVVHRGRVKEREGEGEKLVRNVSGSNNMAPCCNWH